MAARPHSGQALIVMLAFIAALVGGFLVVFGIGQTVNDKMKLMNAADAAAYSAAQWQARSLNYQAYLNRAIVANEVAIAQLVSLRSWSDYMDQTLRNGSRVASFVPPIAPALRSLERGWAAVDRAIQEVAGPLEGGLSRWNVDVLATAQAMAHQQAPIVAADLVEQVAHANEPRSQVYEASRLLQVRNAATWQHRFTARYQRGGGDLDRFATLLMDSRDGFTMRRSHDLLPPASPVQVSRRGGTDLIGEYSWRGVDTLSAHIDLLFDELEVPLGWGAAEQQRQATLRRGLHGGSLRRNPRASRIAMRTLTPLRGYRGIPEIRDVVQPARQDDRRLTYSVALRLPRDQVETADRLLAPQGLALFSGPSESLAPEFSGDALHALGTAEIYFQRPVARSDRRQEFPNLFNPYWQARLAATPDADRVLTAALRGLVIDPFVGVP